MIPVYTWLYNAAKNVEDVPSWSLVSVFVCVYDPCVYMAVQRCEECGGCPFVVLGEGVCVSMCVYIYIYIGTYIHTITHAQVSDLRLMLSCYCLLSNMYTCMYVHTHVYTYTHAYTYTHTHRCRIFTLC